jgi:hypothetical protein
LPLQFGDPAPRLIEASDFGLRLMRQVGEFLEYPANRLGWRGRGKQMTFAGPWMSGAYPIGAKMHDPRSPEGRAEGMKFALFQVTQLEPVGL